MKSKQELVKEILSIRHKKSRVKESEVREIQIFEDQVEKSLRRVEPASYIAKKFDNAELEQIKAAYEAL